MVVVIEKSCQHIQDSTTDHNKQQSQVDINDRVAKKSLFLKAAIGIIVEINTVALEDQEKHIEQHKQKDKQGKVMLVNRQ